MLSLNQVIQAIFLVSCTQHRTVIAHARVSPLGSSRRSSKLKYGLILMILYTPDRGRGARDRERVTRGRRGKMLVVISIFQLDSSGFPVTNDVQ